MKGGGVFRGVCLATVTFACALILSTCGGKQSSVVSGQSSDWRTGGLPAVAGSPVISQGVGGADQPRETPETTGVAVVPTAVSLDQALAELDALPTPEDVDASLFSELKEALREALVGRVGRGFIPAEEGTARLKSRPTQGIKIVSKPPTGEANKVDDLEVTDLGDGTYTLTWHYRNCGDYNQDGIVNIMDITPLAAHFNEATDETNEWVDGNGDTAITILDVTPLAAGFFNTVDHYEVEASHLDFGPWNIVANAPLVEVTGERMRLTYDLGSSPAYTFWRVVPVDAEGKRGEPSNVASLAIEQPVEIIAVNPLGGVAGSEVTFVAIVIGNPPFDFEWDFGGGATPDEVSGSGFEVSAEVTLGVVGQYGASLVVSNVEGSDSRNFTLTVTEIPGNPPEILSVTPTEGDSGSEVTFSAEVTGDAPLTYEWNFGGGASPNLSTEASPTVTLGRGGTLPEPTETYPARLTVSNSSGTAIHDFALSITAWWHVQELPPLPRPPDITDEHIAGLLSPTLTHDGNLTGVYEYWRTGESYENFIAFAKLVGEAWQTEVVVAGQQSPYTSYTSMALDSGDSPAVCWGDYRDGAVHFAAKHGGDWSQEVVAPGGLFAPRTKLFFDSQDRAVIGYSYYTNSGGVSRIARETPSGWEIIEHGVYPYMALRPNCNIVGTYPSEDYAQLWFAEWAGSEWEYQPVYEAPLEERTTPYTIAVASDGLARIVLWGGTSVGVLMARELPSGSFELEPVEGHPSWPSMNISLVLLPGDVELLLFTHYYGEENPILAWENEGIWQYQDAPVTGATDSLSLLIHPGGYLVLVSRTQVAGYW